MDLTSIGLANRKAKFTDGDGYNLLEGARKWREACADIDVNPARILGIGDSVMYGSYASNIVSTNWFNRLRVALQQKLGDNGVGWIPIPSGTTPDQAQWTLAGGGWTIPSGTNNGITARYITATGTGNTATFTITGTALDIVYVKVTDGGTVVITIDGVAQTSINCNGAVNNDFGHVQSYTGLSAGSHTVVLTAPASGKAYLEGAFAYNPPASGPKGLYTYNFAMPGAASDRYTTNISRGLAVANPHLTIIAHGLNDAVTQPSTQNFMSNIGTIIAACQAVGSSVILLSYFPINDTNQLRNANYPILVDRMYQLADRYNCGMIDVFKGWEETYAAAQTAGLMGSGAYDGLSGTDKLHPSDKGMRLIASRAINHLIPKI